MFKVIQLTTPLSLEEGKEGEAKIHYIHDTKT